MKPASLPEPTERPRHPNTAQDTPFYQIRREARQRRRTKQNAVLTHLVKGRR